MFDSGALTINNLSTVVHEHLSLWYKVLLNSELLPRISSIVELSKTWVSSNQITVYFMCVFLTYTVIIVRWRTRSSTCSTFTEILSVLDQALTVLSASISPVNVAHGSSFFEICFGQSHFVSRSQSWFLNLGSQALLRNLGITIMPILTSFEI